MKDRIALIRGTHLALVVASYVIWFAVLAVQQRAPLLDARVQLGSLSRVLAAVQIDADRRPQLSNGDHVRLAVDRSELAAHLLSHQDRLASKHGWSYGNEMRPSAWLLPYELAESEIATASLSLDELDALLRETRFVQAFEPNVNELEDALVATSKGFTKPIASVEIVAMSELHRDDERASAIYTVEWIFDVEDRDDRRQTGELTRIEGAMRTLEFESPMLAWYLSQPEAASMESEEPLAALYAAWHTEALGTMTLPAAVAHLDRRVTDPLNQLGVFGLTLPADITAYALPLVMFIGWCYLAAHLLEAARRTQAKDYDRSEITEAVWLPLSRERMFRGLAFIVGWLGASLAPIVFVLGVPRSDLWSLEHLAQIVLATAAAGMSLFTWLTVGDLRVSRTP
ncbi:MAG: hypothetical protein AAF297_08045 [Planctomycetota bacterium]